MTESSSSPAPMVTLYATDARGATVQLDAVTRGKYPWRFCTMFQPAAAALATMDRPACYHRTLLHLITVLDPVQFRKISAREIAEATKQSASSVERALTMMQADGVLIANEGKTASKGRRLNNRLVWASTATLHSETPMDEAVTDARGRQ